MKQVEKPAFFVPWGRGIDIMLEECKEYSMPEPLIEEDQGRTSSSGSDVAYILENAPIAP